MVMVHAVFRRMLSNPLISVLVIVAASKVAKGCNSFFPTCTDLSYASGILSGNCYTPSGEKPPTSIDLNGRLTNQNGMLRAADNGIFRGSCDDGTLDGAVLNTRCYTRDNTPSDTAVNLNVHISNNLGQFKFCP